jgi:regulator of PEP synthase PpsR (kinase-PPPase family)
MEREFGGGEQWQADATQRWLSCIAAELKPGSIAVLDGQTRPSFVNAAREHVPALRVQILLLDCSPAVRRHRLELRRQPELANLQMDMWAAYLRGQADALGLAVVDTTNMTVEEVADAIEAQIHEG